jgi:phosphopantothenoylcysteine decarboxylase/phosphopantothenate--cysteine ligase
MRNNVSGEKEIILGVTGSIAAYKAYDLIRRLQEKNIKVIPVVTEEAKHLLSIEALQYIANSKVYSEMFAVDDWEIEHVSLIKRAKLILIAPATANIIAKIACGICDDLLTTITLAGHNLPVVIAPAMNKEMYTNPILQKNIAALKNLGYHIIGPERGPLACGDEGVGRLANLQDITDYVVSLLESSGGRFLNKKVLVTAGPTREYIDPIRYISNPASGYLGYKISEIFSKEGANVILISGPTHLPPPVARNITFVAASTASDMYNSVRKFYPSCDIFISTAAVSDWTIQEPSATKIKKTNKNKVLTLVLTETVDILKECAKDKGNRLLIGFAVETEDLVENAKKKMEEKKLDMVVVTTPESMGRDVMSVVKILLNGKEEVIEKENISKDALAYEIVEIISTRYFA